MTNRRRRPSFTTSELKMIRRYPFEERYTIEELCELSNLSRATVLRVLVRRGVQVVQMAGVGLVVTSEELRKRLAPSANLWAGCRFWSDDWRNRGAWWRIEEDSYTEESFP